MSGSWISWWKKAKPEDNACGPRNSKAHIAAVEAEQFRMQVGTHTDECDARAKIIALENKIFEMQKRQERLTRTNYWEIDSNISDAKELLRENTSLKLRLREFEDKLYQNQVQLALKDTTIRKNERMLRENADKITELERKLAKEFMLFQYFKRECHRLRKELAKPKMEIPSCSNFPEL
ncbi:Hypothetical predicted protein [Cloeon dipterum]|uniref:Uncharacterized protein n=2 Tax=Cloeon dipterum TaxID=197152 RepID=A0A8S1CAW1_9INSE|nr:Hypothetical predicted protein [Cloeon dipterum]